MKKRKSCLGMLLRMLITFLCAYLLIYYGAGMILRSVYPMKYEEAVTAASEETGVPLSLIYAVIKTESDFEPNAASHAGAIGVMQMLPETFEWIQQQTQGQALLTEEALSDPEVSIYYGSLLLEFLIDRYGDVGTALCAYNAGIGNADRWLADPACSSDGKRVENIPFGETRRYVKRVEWAQKIYVRLYDELT